MGGGGWLYTHTLYLLVLIHNHGMTWYNMVGWLTGRLVGYGQIPWLACLSADVYIGSAECSTWVDNVLMG